MYIAGMQPKVNKLMPTVVFPVSRGTPMISPLVRWQHSDDWHVAIYKNEVRLIATINWFYANTKFISADQTGNWRENCNF